MAIITINFRSKALDVDIAAAVISPCDGNMDTGCTLYLLHGAADNSLSWMRKTDIEKYAEKYGCTVIMPDGHKSYYTDMKNGMSYFSFISEELPQLCGKLFNIHTCRERTFIAGNSMGGYGALKCAFTNPDRYSKAVSLSGAVDIRGRISRRAALPVHRQRELRGIFGETPEICPSDDLYKLAGTLSSEKKEGPSALSICGSSDMLADMNRSFGNYMKALPYPFQYIEKTGGHDWEFWNAQLGPMFEFLFS